MVSLWVHISCNACIDNSYVTRKITIPHLQLDSCAWYSQCSKYYRCTCHCLSPSLSEVSGIILDCTEWVWMRKSDSRTFLLRRSYHGKHLISKDIDELRMNWRDGSTDTEINSVTNILNGLTFFDISVYFDSPVGRVV